MPDAAALARLHAACFTAPPPWSAGEIAGALAAPGAFLLEGPGGFLIGRALAGEAEVLTLAVDPARRRQGTGRALLDRFLQEAAARGAESAFLEVAEDNAAARALYAAAGFRPAGRRRGYARRPDGAAVDALILTRPVPPADAITI
jgi:ribosomal-protein-alanine N-acetyltransferase